MNMFDDLAQPKENPAIVQQAQPFDKQAYANKKVDGVLKVLSTIDQKVQMLANPKKGEENPEASKLIDSLMTKRQNLVNGLQTPEFYSLVRASSHNNGDVFLKAIPPKAYEMMSPEQQKRVQDQVTMLNNFNTQDAQRQAGTIMGAAQ